MCPKREHWLDNSVKQFRPLAVTFVANRAVGVFQEEKRDQTIWSVFISLITGLNGPVGTPGLPTGLEGYEYTLSSVQAHKLALQLGACIDTRVCHVCNRRFGSEVRHAGCALGAPCAGIGTPAECCDCAVDLSTQTSPTPGVNPVMGEKPVFGGLLSRSTVDRLQQAKRPAEDDHDRQVDLWREGEGELP